MENNLIPKEAEKLSNDAEMMLAEAGKVVVNNQEQYQSASITLKSIKGKAKELTDTRVSITKPLDESKKRIMDFFRGPLEYLEKAERIIKGSMIGYTDEQDRIAREAQEKLRIAAEKEAEYQRKLAEKRATTQEKHGNTEAAEEIRQEAEAIVIFVPEVEPEKPTAAGTSIRITWSAEVTDKLALIKAVAAGTVPHTVLDANMKSLNQMARALKNEMNYPGVRAVATKGIAA